MAAQQALPARLLTVAQGLAACGDSNDKKRRLAEKELDDLHKNEPVSSAHLFASFLQIKYILKNMICFFLLELGNLIFGSENQAWHSILFSSSVFFIVPLPLAKLM